jgi:hypothetical protein
VSLLTEALQLRKNQPRSRVQSGESFPPMRGASPAGKLFALLGIVVGLVVLGFWKGTWLLEQVESLAGIRANVPAAVVAEKAVAVETPSTRGVARALETAKPAIAAEEAVARNSGPGGIPGNPVAAATVAPLEQAPAAVAPKKPVGLPAELEPMDVNLSLALIEDEKARQQLDEENQRKIESFLRKMDVQGVCHQGEDSTAMVDTVLVRPGDPVGDFGLTLRTIEPRRLVFADRQGREYSKSY